MPYATCIERTRSALMARLADAPAGEVVREYFERGKMLRAFLVFAATAAVGGEPDDVVMGAEAIELLHGASLFHDDIIDGASMRRGIPSLHQRLGVGPALVVGDELLLRAFATLAEASSRHPAARVLAATDTLNRLARDCCRGQFEELCSDRWVSEKEYLAIVAGKTAAPFVAAGSLGVLLGGGTRIQLERMQTFAQDIGVAFQIGDDLLDLVGEARLLGKPAGNSLAQGRPMLPLVYLWEQSTPAEQAELRRRNGSEWRRAELVRVLDDRCILDRTRQRQAGYVDAALAALEGFQAPAVEALRALAATAAAPTARG